MGTYIYRHLDGLAAGFVVVKGVVVLCPAGRGDEVEDGVVAGIAQRQLIHPISRNLSQAEVEQPAGMFRRPKALLLYTCLLCLRSH